MEFAIKTVDATIDNMHEVLGFLEEELEKHEASMKNISIITVCAEEMYSNIALYGYPDGNVGQVVTKISFEDNDMEIEFDDTAIPFNPLEHLDPDITLSAEERSIGGLGIFMVKKSMDKVEYEYVDGHNIFRMRKAIK